MDANDRIEVAWEPAFCIHAAECLRGLPAVFANQRRPWGNAEKVRALVTAPVAMASLTWGNAGLEACWG